MSDDHPDEDTPSDPRPSGRIRIVGAQPATGEFPAVGAPPAAEPTEPPPAEDPNRFGAIPVIAADEPPPAASEPPLPPPPPPPPPRPVAAVPTRPAPDLDDLDLPPTAAVPVVDAGDDLDDIRVWAAPAEDEEPLIEAGRSAVEDPFADLAAGHDDPYAALAAEQDDDLPHWTEPPSGPVDAVGDDDVSSGVSGGPRWRGQGEESGEPVDFSDLADETRVEPMGGEDVIFDDLGAGRAEPFEAAAGPPQRRSPYPDAPLDEGGEGPSGPRDLQQAVLVGVGLVILLFVCALIGAKALVVLATVIVVMATAEFFTAARRAGYHPAPLVGLAGSAGMVLAAYWRGEGAIPLVMFLVVVTTLCWWLFDAGPGDHAVANAGVTVLGVMYIGGLGSFAALLLKFPDGIGMLIGAVLVAVAADVGGLFVGQRMGNTPLTAASPNKTVEGFVGGIVVAIIVSCAVLGVIGVFPWEFKDALVLGLVGGIMTPLGDLCESRLKRDLGVKDMGHILPGHGGVLDRFDGLLFVLPATYYVVRLLEVYANTP